MANDSSTGGPLAPAAAPAPTPLEGQALLTFIQNWIVGIIGLPGDMVRPRWQPEPGNIPDAGDCWAAIGITRRPSDTYPYVAFVDDANPPTYQMQRHEDLETLCSFYDLGSTGQADMYAALLRDGTAIPQNREPLRAGGFAFVSCGDITPVPSLLKSRWLYRVDLPLTLRREIDRNYPVLPVVEGDATLYANDGQNTLTRTIIAK